MGTYIGRRDSSQRRLPALVFDQHEEFSVDSYIDVDQGSWQNFPGQFPDFTRPSGRLSHDPAQYNSERWATGSIREWWNVQTSDDQSNLDNKTNTWDNKSRYRLSDSNLKRLPRLQPNIRQWRKKVAASEESDRHNEISSPKGIRSFYFDLTSGHEIVPDDKGRRVETQYVYSSQNGQVETRLPVYSYQQEVQNVGAEPGPLRSSQQNPRDVNKITSGTKIDLDRYYDLDSAKSGPNVVTKEFPAPNIRPRDGYFKVKLPPETRIAYSSSKGSSSNLINENIKGLSTSGYIHQPPSQAYSWSRIIHETTEDPDQYWNQQRVQGWDRNHSNKQESHTVRKIGSRKELYEKLQKQSGKGHQTAELSPQNSWFNMEHRTSGSWAAGDRPQDRYAYEQDYEVEYAREQDSSSLGNKDYSVPSNQSFPSSSSSTVSAQPHDCTLSGVNVFGNLSEEQEALNSGRDSIDGASMYQHYVPNRLNKTETGFWNPNTRWRYNILNTSDCSQSNYSSKGTVSPPPHEMSHTVIYQHRGLSSNARAEGRLSFKQADKSDHHVYLPRSTYHIIREPDSSRVGEDDYCNEIWGGIPVRVATWRLPGTWRSDGAR